MEIVGAWLATATAMPPVVTKCYDVDLPLGRPCHKRIAYANPWSAARVFRLVSSDHSILRPRYESLEVMCCAEGFGLARCRWDRPWRSSKGNSRSRGQAALRFVLKRARLFTWAIGAGADVRRGTGKRAPSSHEACFLSRPMRDDARMHSLNSSCRWLAAERDTSDFGSPLPRGFARGERLSCSSMTAGDRTRSAC